MHLFIFYSEHGTEVPSADILLSSEDKILLKRRVFALKRNSLPPVVTHNMADDASDPILNQVRRVQLFNRPSDRVKVIFHPEFLNSNNPILGLDYEEFVRGVHLGVFPSYCTFSDCLISQANKDRRAIRLYPCRVHCHGHPECHHQFVGFRMLYGGFTGDARGKLIHRIVTRADLCRTTDVTLLIDAAKAWKNPSISWSVYPLIRYQC